MKRKEFKGLVFAFFFFWLLYSIRGCALFIDDYIISRLSLLSKGEKRPKDETKTELIKKKRREQMREKNQNNAAKKKKKKFKMEEVIRGGKTQNKAREKKMSAEICVKRGR